MNTSAPKYIDPKRTELLKGLLAIGYEIEDMSEYGEEWKGQYRFLLPGVHECDFGNPQPTPEAAEDELLQYAPQDAAHIRCLEEGVPTEREVMKLNAYTALGF